MKNRRRKMNFSLDELFLLLAAVAAITVEFLPAAAVTIFAAHSNTLAGLWSLFFYNSLQRFIKNL